MACNESTPETLTQIECVGTLLLYQDENGDVTTIDIADKIPANVVTSLSFDLATKTITFVNEEGATDVVDLSPCFPPSSYNSVLHQVTLDGVVYPLNVSELEIDYATKELVYTDDAGVVTRLDLSPCIPPLSTFAYDASSHTVTHNGVTSLLNCGVPSFNPATCELGYVDEKGIAYSWFIPQDSFALSPDGRTLTINPAKGGVLNIDIGQDEVTFEMTPDKQLKLTVGGNTTCIQLPNSLVGCSYDQAANTLRLIHCDGTEDVKQLATAGLECTVLPDGTQVLCFTSGTGVKKLFSIPAVQMDIDGLTVAGSVLSFTFGGDGNDDSVVVDICQIVADNCNAHFPSIDPLTGEWSFIDNAGNTYSYPGFPIRSIKCIDATGAIIDVAPDADACVTIPQHFPQVVSPDGTIAVNFVNGVWEITTPPDTDTWGEPQVAQAAGTDFYGVSYVAGDNLFVTPSGNIVCIPDKVEDTNTDTWGEPQAAPAAGTDFYGVPYAAGDNIFVTPTGNVVCIPAKVVDTNDWGVPSISTVAGTDVYGVPYAVGDKIFTTPDGEIICIPDKVEDTNTDTFGAPQVATAAGTDFFGVPYAVGANLYVNAQGQIVCIPSKEDLDTFGAPQVATAAGTDFFGVPYEVGDNLYINADGLITCIPDKVEDTNTDTNTHTTVTSNDSSVTVVAGTNAAGAPEFDLSVEHPTYVDKNGDDLADGAELMTLGGFPDAGVALPPTAKVLGVDDAGDCMQFDPPAGGGGGTPPSSIAFVDAAETDAGALIRHDDGLGNTFDFCNGGKCYEQQLRVAVLGTTPVSVADTDIVPYSDFATLPGNNCYGPCGPPPGGDLFEFDPADGGVIRILRPGIYNASHYLQTVQEDDIDYLQTELQLNGSTPNIAKFGAPSGRFLPETSRNAIQNGGALCFCVTPEDIAAGPTGAYATVGVEVVFRPLNQPTVGLVTVASPQVSASGVNFEICGKVFECDD